MNKSLAFGLALFGLTLSGNAQTNEEIWSDYAVGVQNSKDVDLSFQGKAPFPERLLKYDQGPDYIKFTCDNGFLEFSYYSENILHVQYYLTKDKHVKSWGIQPSQKVVKSQVKRTGGNRISFRSSRVNVDIDPLNANFSIRDSSNHEVLKSVRYYLEPVKIYGKNELSSTITFAAPEDENYYGMGQRQDGSVNHRGKVLNMWHDYNAHWGEVISIPFLMTNKKYAIVYDNPARMKVACGINGKTTWKAESAKSISFYVILGETPAEILKGYGELCGYAPLPPVKALGYIQCKQRYSSQEEILKVANGYVDRKYPIDYMVVDWFHWKTLGDLSMNPEYWPNPSEMNKELKSHNINSMITCWPRFTKQSTNFALLDKNGWLLRDKNGNSMNGTAWDGRGGVIDATNPQAAEWYWNTVKKNYVNKGFDSFWLDESEPDVIPHSYVMHEGNGHEIYNLYPYYHAKGLYEGHRSESNDRVFILTRSSYLGAHRFGTTFWSSDIVGEWDVLRRQVACGLNVTVSGMPYWSSDIGGWHGFWSGHKVPDAKLLITSDDGQKGMYKDYPEMYIRWFQYGCFCPTFRAHGSRRENEVWSYGSNTEKVLVKFLKLRYKLMPYLYSSAWKVTTDNLPFMRALFVDYMNDPKCLDIRDQYLFGQSLMVAPITAAGQDKREVYMPANNDWYNFWTNKKYEGGKTAKVDAPIDQIPIFVKAGTILPKYNDMLRADEKKNTIDLFIYSGANGEYTLYEDDGKTYNYEKGESSFVDFLWNNKSKSLKIAKREGKFDINRVLKVNIVFVNDSSKTIYDNETIATKSVDYNGQEISVNL